MPTPSSPTRHLTRRRTAFALPGLIVLLGFLLLSSCEKDPVEIIPASGVIELTALTEGPGPYPDSFNVFVNGGRSGSVPPNGVMALSALPRGRYLVALYGDEKHCWYGLNTRQVTVVPNDTSFITFLIRCR